MAYGIPTPYPHSMGPRGAVRMIARWVESGGINQFVPATNQVGIEFGGDQMAHALAALCAEIGLADNDALLALVNAPSRRGLTQRVLAACRRAERKLGEEGYY